jgi:serine protein kinase
LNVPAELELFAQIRRSTALKQAEKDESIHLETYVELVKQRPTVADRAHARIFHMLEAGGFVPDEAVEGMRASFFDDEVFGLGQPLSELVEYFRTAARGHPTRRRILLLWGPPGGAKSTIATCLKRGLEAWSRTDEGAVFALEGCPMHEEPLHLIPAEAEPGGPSMRERLQRYTGVDVEGGLCPVCALRLEEEFEGDPERFPIVRVLFSESRRTGIGTFAPSDPKSMSTEQLTGGVNFKLLETYGSDDDPRALDWAGEFSKANRGLLECIEFLKNPKEFLVEFLTLSQERQFKVPKFGFIDADMVLLAHTNESEFRQRMSDPTNEALRSRLYTIPVPYNVRLSDESRIYTKLLSESAHDFHIDPTAIDAASAIAVLTRLTDYPNLTAIEKLHLYDGRETGDFKLNQLPEIRKLSVREGLDGVDPRFVIDALSRAVAETELEQAANGRRPCLTTVMALRALRNSIERSQQIGDEAKKTYLALVTEARQEIDRQLKDQVRKAFVPAFADTAQELLENYLNHCEAYCGKEKVVDAITGEELDPDEKLLRGVEEMIGISENAKDGFRAGVLMRIGMWLRKGRPLSYNSDDQLGRAIEAYLFEEMKDIVRITVSKRSPDTQHAERLNEVIRVLCDDRGYCPTCSSELLDYVGALLNR